MTPSLPIPKAFRCKFTGYTPEAATELFFDWLDANEDYLGQFVSPIEAVAIHGSMFTDIVASSSTDPVIPPGLPVLEFTNDEGQ